MITKNLRLEGHHEHLLVKKTKVPNEISCLPKPFSDASQILFLNVNGQSFGTGFMSSQNQHYSKTV